MARELDDLSKKLRAKTQFLTFISDETEEILKNNSPRDIQRQLNIYEKKIEEFHELKYQIQEIKLEEEEPSAVREWRTETDQSLKKFEPHIEQLKEALKAIKFAE